MRKFFLSLLSDRMILALAVDVLSKYVKNKESRALYAEDIKALRDVLAEYTD